MNAKLTMISQNEKGETTIQLKTSEIDKTLFDKICSTNCENHRWSVSFSVKNQQSGGKKIMGSIRLHCPETDCEELQFIVRESEDGITLKCNGCGKEHSHEIGELAHLFDPTKTVVQKPVKEETP